LTTIALLITLNAIIAEAAVLAYNTDFIAEAELF
jgi:hypothetical protein